MRLFVSVAVPEISLEGARLGGPDAPPHLTVLFLGEVTPDRVDPLAEAFASSVRSHPPFPLELAGVGAFPNVEHPRVVWIGVRAGAKELEDLHDRLVRACRTLSLRVEDRPLVPHLTLRRVRGPRDAELARRWVAELGTKEFGRSEVAQLELKESMLGSGAVVHRTVARLPLDGAPSTA
jgi:RNA 2',3'-cyclic 3'-phosphodiesterase